MSCQCGAPLPQKNEESNYAPLDKAFERISSQKKGLTDFDKLLIIVIVFALCIAYKKK